MKYFSIKYWSQWDDPNQVTTKYKQYIEAVRSELPQSLQRLFGAGGTVSLNDTRLHRFVADVTDLRVTIELHGDIKDSTKRDPRNLEWSIVASGVVLIYNGVSDFTSQVDSEGVLDGSQGYGDHGFDEIEMLENGVFQHRMLFSSGIELSVTFKEFILTYLQPTDSPAT